MSDENEFSVEEPIKKRCFIITPVGSDNSPIRRAAEGVIDSAIVPVLNELDFETDIPHRLLNSGSITKAVINMIVNDNLVIANLTGLNPNVMYELGIRHAARKPVVHICEAGTQLPFDIAPERTLFYINDMLGIKEFIPKLKALIAVAMQEAEPSNPVYDAIQAKAIMQKVSNDDDPLKYVIQAIETLKDSFASANNVSTINRNKPIRNFSSLAYNIRILSNVDHKTKDTILKKILTRLNDYDITPSILYSESEIKISFNWRLDKELPEDIFNLFNDLGDCLIRKTATLQD